MPSVYSISLVQIVNDLAKFCGYSENEIYATVSSLICLWRDNDRTREITSEFIRYEMDLDSVCSEMLIAHTMDRLEYVGREIRDFAVSGRLSRWMVREMCILLELTDVD